MRESDNEMENEQSATVKMTEIAQLLALDQVDKTDFIKNLQIFMLY